MGEQNLETKTANINITAGMPETSLPKKNRRRILILATIIVLIVIVGFIGFYVNKKKQAVKTIPGNLTNKNITVPVSRQTVSVDSDGIPFDLNLEPKITPLYAKKFSLNNNSDYTSIKQYVSSQNTYNAYMAIKSSLNKQGWVVSDDSSNPVTPNEKRLALFAQKNQFITTVDFNQRPDGYAQVQIIVQYKIE